MWNGQVTDGPPSCKRGGATTSFVAPVRRSPRSRRFAVARSVSIEPIEPFAMERVGDQGGARASRYSRAEIVDAIRRWAGQYGAPPTRQDWEPSDARRSGNPRRAERFEAGEWPSARMVRRQFGSFGAARAAAGFEPGAERLSKPHL